MRIIIENEQDMEEISLCENQNPYCGGDNGACFDSDCLGESQDTGDCIIGG